MIFKFNYHGPANIYELSTSERIIFFIKLQYSKFCFLTFSSHSVLSVTQRYSEAANTVASTLA